MKLAPVAVLLLLVVAALPAGANPEYPKVGFEIEIGKINVVRYDGNAFTDIYEKTPGSYLAETRGIVADNPSRTWPLLQLTADNVKEPNDLVLKLHESLDDATSQTPNEHESYRGVLEIVTGPMLHDKPVQEDVVKAARLFVTTLYDFCAKSGQPASNYYAVSALVEEYNARLNVQTYTTTLDKELLEFRIVGANTAYLSCTGPEYAKSIETANLGIDVQATFGTPLRFLDDSGDGITTWHQPDAGLGTLQSAFEGESLSEDQRKEFLGLMSEVQQKEFLGLVRLWYPLMRCALRPNDEGEKAAGLVVLCNKNFARPLPRVDVCALSDRFWAGFSAADRGTISEVLEPSLLEMAKRLTSESTATSLKKLGLPPGSQTKRTTAEMKKEDEVRKAIAGMVLRGTEACGQVVESRNGSYLAYADGTTIPPLTLKLSDTESLPGFGLEIRASSALSSQFHNPKELVAEVRRQLKRYFGNEAGRILSGPANPPMPTLQED